VLLLSKSGIPAGLAAALASAGLAVTATDPAAPVDVPAGHYVAVVDASDPDAAADASRRWRPRLSEAGIPILWLTAGGDPADGFLHGADVCLGREAPPALLAGQVRALVRLGQASAALTARALAAGQLNGRLQQAYRQIDQDLELARRIQRSLLPRTLPEVAQARFAVCHRPRSRVGGDFYDVTRLDEEHVAFYLADTLGTGGPSSGLLAVYLKRSIQSKEIIGRSYRLVPPDEVLQRLHRELSALGLGEMPSLTVVYGLLNCRDGQLTYARAAHPNPVYLPRQGPAEFWTAAGSLLGVVEGEYVSQSRQLRSGDKLVLVSDGLVPAKEGGPPVGDLVRTAAERHRGLPVQSFVERVTAELLTLTRQPDDFTLLGLEMLPAG
jgi:serine phosphatase RsbU (regulator of sigma subunit)